MGYFAFRIKGIDAETAQRANQRSSTLFGKLKKHYEQQRNAAKAKKKEDKSGKPKLPAVSSPKMKSLAATRSEQLLVKSREFKQKKKSEEELKEKEKQKVIEEADRKWKENDGMNIEEKECTLNNFDVTKECQGMRILDHLRLTVTGNFVRYILQVVKDISR